MQTLPSHPMSLVPPYLGSPLSFLSWGLLVEVGDQPVERVLQDLW